MPSTCSEAQLSIVVKALRYQSWDRLPVVSLGIFSIATDRTMCPGVDSAYKNEYQGFLLVRKADDLPPSQCRTSRKSGALTYLEPLGPPRRVVGELYLLHVSNPRVHLHEDGCICSYGTVRFTCIGINSLVDRRVCIEHTLLLSRLFMPMHIKRTIP